MAEYLFKIKTSLSKEELQGFLNIFTEIESAEYIDTKKSNNQKNQEKLVGILYDYFFHERIEVENKFDKATDLFEICSQRQCISDVCDLVVKADTENLAKYLKNKTDEDLSMEESCWIANRIINNFYNLKE